MLRFGWDVAIDAGSVYSWSIDARHLLAEKSITLRKGGRESKAWATWDSADSVRPLINLSRVPENLLYLCLNRSGELDRLLGSCHFRYPANVIRLPSSRFYSKDDQYHQSYIAPNGSENFTIATEIKRWLRGPVPLLLTTSFNPGGEPPARSLATAKDYAAHLGVRLVVYNPRITEEERKGSFPAIRLNDDGTLQVVRAGGDISDVINRLRKSGYKVLE
jgi:hypothetical protein